MKLVWLVLNLYYCSFTCCDNVYKIVARISSAYRIHAVFPQSDVLQTSCFRCFGWSPPWGTDGDKMKKESNGNRNDGRDNPVIRFWWRSHDKDTLSFDIVWLSTDREENISESDYKFMTPINIIMTPINISLKLKLIWAAKSGLRPLISLAKPGV